MEMDTSVVRTAVAHLPTVSTCIVSTRIVSTATVYTLNPADSIHTYGAVYTALTGINRYFCKEHNDSRRPLT